MQKKTLKWNIQKNKYSLKNAKKCNNFTNKKHNLKKYTEHMKNMQLKKCARIWKICRNKHEKCKQNYVKNIQNMQCIEN